MLFHMVGLVLVAVFIHVRFPGIYRAHVLRGVLSGVLSGVGWINSVTYGIRLASHLDVQNCRLLNYVMRFLTDAPTDPTLL